MQTTGHLELVTRIMITISLSGDTQEMQVNKILVLVKMLADVSMIF